MTSPPLQGQQKAFDADSGWEAAHAWLRDYLESPRKADTVLPEQRMRDSIVDRRARRLFHNALRHRIRVEQCLSRHWRRQPRSFLRALLLLGGAEALDTPEVAEKIVHGTVAFAKSRCSVQEARFVNALLRAVLPELRTSDPGSTAPPEVLGHYFSHPAWLVARWRACYGPEATYRLLRWNQRPPRQYLRVMAAAEAPPGCIPTPWPGFFVWTAHQREGVAALLARGHAYVQDPFTRIPVEQLAVQPGERVLDLCAAPGGKSVHLARAVEATGSLTCVDLPGERLDRLEQNLQTLPPELHAIVRVRPGDLEARRGAFFEEGESSLEQFDAVLLDVPCSNTGVIRRRPDIKHRLSEREVRSIAAVQSNLLQTAAELVRPGGRLVYSTCSLEPEENSAQVAAFLGSPIGRAFRESAVAGSFPPEAGHDGGGSHRLDRIERSGRNAKRRTARVP